MRCWFRDMMETPCDAPLMRCHVVSQRAIKREHERSNPRVRRFDFEATPLTGTRLATVLDDPRNWRWGCWRHHQQVDGPTGGWPELPPSSFEFAEEYGLVRLLPETQQGGSR